MKAAKSPTLAMEGVTLSKALNLLSVTVTPDTYLISGTNEQTCTHKIENQSPFPIVVKFMSTAAHRFSVSKSCLLIGEKSWADVEIKLSMGAMRSHRIDMLMLPCIISLNPNWEQNPSIAFNTPYKPIVRCLRYKAPRPWTAVLDEIIQSTHEISKNITDCCLETQIFESSKNHISLNEFAILDEAFGQNLEKDPVKSIMR